MTFRGAFVGGAATGTRAIMHTSALGAHGTPMVNVENVAAVYAKLENRPGTLERLTKVLGERRINIDSISLETVGSTGFVRLVVQRPREVVDACKQSGIDCYESQVILVHLPNKAGELHRASADLAASGINVESILTTAEGRLAIRTSDNERAAMILRKL